MKIITKYSLGEPVKIVGNIIKDGKVTGQFTCDFGYVKEIVIRIDKITNQPYVMYRLSENNCLYSEKSLIEANFK